MPKLCATWRTRWAAVIPRSVAYSAMPSESESVIQRGGNSGSGPAFGGSGAKQYAGAVPAGEPKGRRDAVRRVAAPPRY